MNQNQNIPPEFQPKKKVHFNKVTGIRIGLILLCGLAGLEDLI